MSNKQFADFADTLGHIDDAIYISDGDNIIRFMNLTMIRIHGDRVGEKCYESIHGRRSMCPKCKIMEDSIGNSFCSEPNELIINGRHYESVIIPIRSSGENFLRLNLYKDVIGKKDQSKHFKLYKDDYKRIFNHVGVGVFISSKEGKFLDANPALLEMLRYKSKRQFLKLDLARDLYLNPNERTKFQKMVEAEGKVNEYNVVWKCNEHGTISVLLTAYTRHDSDGKVVGYEGICVDQSQRLKMEKELREAHVFLNKTIQSSPNAIIATDMNGNIIIWNRGAEETFQYTAKEVIEKMNVTDLYQNQNFAKEVMKMIRSEDYGGEGKLRAYPMSFSAKDGCIVEGNLSANIIYNEHMEEMASVGIFVDLMGQLDMERKLRTTQEQLLQSEKLAAMGRLTSQIAHELNNPLYGIMNTFELLKTEISPDNKRRKLLDMALSETERLADMLRKMLSFSRPDQEEHSLVDVNIILDEILLLYQKQLCEHSIKIFSHMDKSTTKLYASKNQLRQVFLNMISNARDAMPNGGTLTVTTKGTKDYVTINITDTGIGIKEEHLGLIFETFFTTKTDSVKGVGLGLSVCYGFIKDHGGDIKVKTNAGKGTSFIVTLPVHIDRINVQPYS